MSNRFFEHPILNSPYEYPGRHWELDSSERGLCVMQQNAYFKVLDVVSEGDKRQTTLIHIPEFLVGILDSSEFTSFEENLIDLSRMEFKKLKDVPPVPALTKEDAWIDRVSSPLGMDDRVEVPRTWAEYGRVTGAKI